MSASLKDLQAWVLESVGGHLPRYGFARRPVGQSFYRQESFGRSTLHLSFIRHDVDFDVTADVALRVDAVEELVNADSALLSKTERRRTATVGAELGNIARGAPFRWTVQAEPDVPVAEHGVLQAFETFGLPYIDRFTDLDEMLRVLGSNQPQDWIHSPVHARRCRSAVALALVLGHHDRVEELIATCDAFLSSRLDPGLSSFRVFADRVRRSVLSG